MITKSQVGDLLTIIVALDRRTIGEADIEAWHLILSDLDIDDCAQAVKDHYTEANNWLMPADVHRRATAIARRREGQRRIAENQARDDAETRAIEAAPAEPVDREALKAKLGALAARGPVAVPRVDWRSDGNRMAEARAELEAVRAKAEQPS